jgi:hypothetical protein
MHFRNELTLHTLLTLDDDVEFGLDFWRLERCRLAGSSWEKMLYLLIFTLQWIERCTLRRMDLQLTWCCSLTRGEFPSTWYWVSTWFCTLHVVLFCPRGIEFARGDLLVHYFHSLLLLRCFFNVAKQKNLKC